MKALKSSQMLRFSLEILCIDILKIFEEPVFEIYIFHLKTLAVEVVESTGVGLEGKNQLV